MGLRSRAHGPAIVGLFVLLSAYLSVYVSYVSLGLRSRAHGPAIVGLFVCRVCLLVGLFVCRVCLLCVYCRPI